MNTENTLQRNNPVHSSLSISYNQWFTFIDVVSDGAYGFFVSTGASLAGEMDYSLTGRGNKKIQLEAAKKTIQQLVG